MGADNICIKDMANLLLPYDAYSLVKRLKSEVDVPIHLHTHNTTGTGDMTYLMAVQAGVDIVAVSYTHLVEGSSMYLQLEETVSLRDLLYGLMLASGNDAAVAIAVHIGHGVAQFANMMNQRAKALGAFNTNFVTPNGLPDPDHYTTASDLSLIHI